MGGVGDSFLAAVGLVAILASVWLSTTSGLLLLDTVRHRIWGPIVALSYAIAFGPLYFFSQLFTGPSWSFSVQVMARAATVVPVLGTVGGVWGFFWRSRIMPLVSTTAARSWSWKDNPVIPALFSMTGVTWPLITLAIFVAALLSPPTSSGGEGSGLFFLLLPFLIALFALFVLIPMVFSLFLLYDPSRHKIWGIALTIWWGFICVYLAVGIVNSLSTPTYPARSYPFDPWGAAVSLTPFLAVIGGVWGTLWHTGRTPTYFAKLIFSLPRRMMLGGLITFFAAVVLNGFFLLLDLLAIVLLVCGMLQMKMPRKGRTLGAIALGSSIAIGLLLPLIVQHWLPFESDWWPSLGEGLAAILIGIALAGSGAVSTMKTETP